MRGEELEYTVTLLWEDWWDSAQLCDITVKIKIQAVLPETDNFYQKSLTSLWRVKNIASGPEVGFGKSKLQ